MPVAVCFLLELFSQPLRDSRLGVDRGPHEAGACGEEMIGGSSCCSRFGSCSPAVSTCLGAEPFGFRLGFVEKSRAFERGLSAAGPDRSSLRPLPRRRRGVCLGRCSPCRVPLHEILDPQFSWDSRHRSPLPPSSPPVWSVEPPGGAVVGMEVWRVSVRGRYRTGVSGGTST